MSIDRDRLKAFLDDLALISVKHGLFVYAHDMWAHDIDRDFIGYGGNPKNEEIWEVSTETITALGSGCVESVDVRTVSAHQRIAIERSLAEVRERADA